MDVNINNSKLPPAVIVETTAIQVHANFSYHKLYAYGTVSLVFCIHKREKATKNIPMEL